MAKFTIDLLTINRYYATLEIEAPNLDAAKRIALTGPRPRPRIRTTQLISGAVPTNAISPLGKPATTSLTATTFTACGSATRLIWRPRHEPAQQEQAAVQDRGRETAAAREVAAGQTSKKLATRAPAKKEKSK